MKDEIKKYVATKMMLWAMKILPKCKFKQMYIQFIVDNIHRL